MRKLTEDQKEGIHQDKINGMRLIDIRKKYGIAESTALKIIKNSPAAEKRPRRKVNPIVFTDEQKLEIIDKYTNKNICQSEIAKSFDVSTKRIKKILLEYEVEIRPCQDFLRKFKVNENFFDEIDSEEKAYFLGILWADGSHDPSKRLVRLQLWDKDKDLIEKLNRLVHPERPIYFWGLNHKHPTWQDTYTLRITSKRISDRLLELGMHRAKTFTLEFPNFIPENLMNHFLRGYIDGDGHFHSRYVNVLGNEIFASGFQLFVERVVGVRCTILDRPDSKIKTFNINGRVQSMKFLNWLYEGATIYMERKFQTYLEFKKFAEIIARKSSIDLSSSQIDFIKKATKYYYAPKCEKENLDFNIEDWDNIL